MKTRIVFYISIFLLAHATFLSAQFKNAEFGVGVLVGGSKLLGDVENTNMGFTSGLMFKYVLTPRFALTLSANYGRMTSVLNAIRTNLGSVSLLGTFVILPNNEFRPFLSLGLARFHYSTRDGSGRLMYRNNGSPILGWKSAMQIGVGFELITGKRWAINTMGNYHITSVDELDAISEGATDGFFHGLIGLVHYFKTGNNNKSRKLGKPDIYQKGFVEEKKTKSKDIQIVKSAPTDQFANGIYFERGTANLLPKSRQQLHKIFSYLYSHPDEELELLGVSSSNQSENSLILERANAVKNYLVNLGIKPEKVIINTK